MADGSLHPGLLGSDDAPVYRLHQAQGSSPFVLLADHAGQGIPRALGDLGIGQAELDRHIGWDIGIAGVTRALARQLDAWAIEQHYSRLVIDCNRPHGSPTLVPAVSDGTVIPANQALATALRQQRIEAIHAPYHAAISHELDHRASSGRATALVLLHSFTPVMNDTPRPWHCGVLYNHDTRLAHALLAALRAEGDLVVGDNQPYAISDDSDYAANVHGEARGLPYVEIEIRQDLIADPAGQRAWADRLARLLPPLLEDIV